MDDKALVIGINSFSDVIITFSECSMIEDSKKLKLTENQVRELENQKSVSLSYKTQEIELMTEIRDVPTGTERPMRKYWKGSTGPGLVQTNLEKVH